MLCLYCQTAAAKGECELCRAEATQKEAKESWELAEKVIHKERRDLQRKKKEESDRRKQELRKVLLARATKAEKKRLSIAIAREKRRSVVTTKSRRASQAAIDAEDKELLRQTDVLAADEAKAADETAAQKEQERAKASRRSRALKRAARRSVVEKRRKMVADIEEAKARGEDVVLSAADMEMLDAAARRRSGVMVTTTGFDLNDLRHGSSYDGSTDGEHARAGEPTAEPAADATATAAGEATGEGEAPSADASPSKKVSFRSYGRRCACVSNRCCCVAAEERCVRAWQAQVRERRVNEGEDAGEGVRHEG